MASLAVTVNGMTCDHCRSKVDEALRGVPGVWGATVDLAARVAEVDYDATQTDPERLIEAVRGAGYDAEVRQ